MINDPSGMRGAHALGRTPVAYGAKPLRVCLRHTFGERQLPAEGNPPAALVSPPAALAH
ncbi:MAG: hypothetical protein KME57_20760 [Scytonema hyalinum WJT4-NPBG1]|nr:hypothetical protein [Scytonema hyalinum WJT4-NPBG1]